MHTQAHIHAQKHTQEPIQALFDQEVVVREACEMIWIYIHVQVMYTYIYTHA